MADKAYEFFNTGRLEENLEIRVPETVRDLYKNEVPLWVKNMGNIAVVKNPYSNAGQGVWTITNEKELDAFMQDESDYDQFIVQALVGNYKWTSRSKNADPFFQVGTVPDKKGNIFVNDFRMQVSFDYKKGCFKPLAMYARKARVPLAASLENQECSSWDMLGTNLSVKLEGEVTYLRLNKHSKQSKQVNHDLIRINKFFQHINKFLS